MSKQITSGELAAIIGELLNHPEQRGELDEASTYQSFMTDLAQVVCNHCGGDVLNPATPLEDVWYVGIHWNDSVPENGGIWRDCDVEADFGPANDSDDATSS